MARTIHAQPQFFTIIDNDDSCPTEGTAFDSSNEDYSAIQTYSAFWVGAKTKSIKKTQGLSATSWCLDYFVPFIYWTNQSAPGGTIESKLYFDHRVSLQTGVTEGRFREVTLIK